MHRKAPRCPAESIFQMVPAREEPDLESGIVYAALEQHEHALVGVGMNGIGIVPASDALNTRDRPPRSLQDAQQTGGGEDPKICGVVADFAAVGKVGDRFLLDASVHARCNLRDAGTENT